MKVAILSESLADEAAVRLLANAILNEETETTSGPKLHARGWPAVLRDVPPVIKHLYFQTDADALIIVVDSNGSDVHQPDHDDSQAGTSCRLCLVRRVVRETTASLPTRRGRGEMKTAVGLAVPAIEAWLLCGIDGSASEAAWIRERERGVRPRDRSRQLKQQVYGTDRPPLQLAKSRASEFAQRVAADLASLERRFPNGFGPLADGLRSW